MAFPAPRLPLAGEEQEQVHSDQKRLQELARQFSVNKVNAQIAELEQVRTIQSLFDVDALLSNRRALLNLGRWSPLPHTCTALTLKQTCTEAAAHYPCTNIKAMAEQWKRRHVGVPAANETPKLLGRQPAQKVCLQQGICVCRGQQKAIAFFWTAAKRVLMSRYQDDPERHALYNASACLLWRAREPNHAEEIASVRMVYIPYFCGKPWQPTFWDVQLEGDLALCFNKDFSEAAPPNDSFVTFTVREVPCGEPAFHTPLQYIASMDLQKRWEVMFLELSSRPTILSRRLFRARFCTEHALNVWDGNEVELARRERRRAEPAQAQHGVVEPDLLEEVAEEGAELEGDAQQETQLTIKMLH